MQVVAPDQFSKEVDLSDVPGAEDEKDDGPYRTGDPELDAYLDEEDDAEGDGPSFTSLDDLDEAAY